MQSITPNSIRSELNVDSETKVLFWTLFHFNLVPYFLPLSGLRYIHNQAKILKHLDNILKKKYYSQLRSLVRKMHNKQSLYFMDNSNFNITKEHLNLPEFAPNILPICIGNLKKNKKKIFQKSSKNLQMCWIGRIESFKTTILIYLIKKLEQQSSISKKKINFSIIGYGNDLEKLKKIKRYNKHLNISFLGAMEPKFMHDYLIKNIDCAFAMGASALESGGLGIPTILLDFSFKGIPLNYNFKWLFESDGNNLGHLIDYSNDFNKHSIRDIISTLENDNSIGLKCMEYVKKHHSAQIIAEKLIKAAKSSNFKWRDFDKKLLRKGIIRKIYEQKFRR